MAKAASNGALHLLVAQWVIRHGINPDIVNSDFTIEHSRGEVFLNLKLYANDLFPVPAPEFMEVGEHTHCVNQKGCTV